MDIDTQKEAFEVYQIGANIGDTTSMRNLALAYQNGFGVPKDYAKAREWFEKAAAKGDADAKMALERLSAGGPSAPR